MMAPFNRSEGIPLAPRARLSSARSLVAESSPGNGARRREAPTRKLVGYVVATYNYDLEFAGPDAFVTELFVRARERGKGYAKLLLQAVTHAVEQKVRARSTCSSPENRGARKLYASVGFEPVPRLVMTKEL